MRVTIPFQSKWEVPMLEGGKTCTSRFRRYGSVGDTFMAFGEDFEIVGLEKHSLGYVATTLFSQEGFATPEELMDFWREIHPKRYQGKRVVWVHRFVRKTFLKSLSGDGNLGHQTTDQWREPAPCNQPHQG